MKSSHAFGFFVFGLVMMMIPRVAPENFSAQGPDGSNAHAIWLVVVGAAQLGISLIWAAQRAISRFADELATFAMPGLDRSPLVPMGSVESAK